MAPGCIEAALRRTHSQNPSRIRPVSGPHPEQAWLRVSKIVVCQHIVSSAHLLSRECVVQPMTFSSSPGPAPSGPAWHPCGHGAGLLGANGEATMAVGVPVCEKIAQ